MATSVTSSHLYSIFDKRCIPVINMHYYDIFTFQCIIADPTGYMLTVIKGAKNIQTIDNLRNLVHKCKVEISNIGIWDDCIRVTEKSRLIFDDEVYILHECLHKYVYYVCVEDS